MKKPISKHNMRQILALVKTQCRLCGVKFSMKMVGAACIGEFSESDKTLTVYRKYRRVKGRRRGKARISDNKPWEILLVAIHEMVHMLQWKRKDVNWFKMYDDENRHCDLIYGYDTCGEYYPRAALIESAKLAAQIEFEADTMSIAILQMFGIPFGGQALYIRHAKAYAYSYLILAHTGIMPSYRTKRRWHRLLTAAPAFDVTSDVFAKMIEMTREDVTHSNTVWDRKKLIKCVALNIGIK